MVADEEIPKALVKRPWTSDEDVKLVEAVQKYGACRWSLIATELGNGRIGKQCRERWNNHLCPEVKKCDWSDEEDKAILRGVEELGTRWCDIIKDATLAGRTDNSIKNRYYSLQRRMKAASRQQAARSEVETAITQPLPPSEGADAMSEEQRDRVMDLAARLAVATDDSEREILINKLHGAMNRAASAEPCITSKPEDLANSRVDLPGFLGSDLNEVAPDIPNSPPPLSWTSSSNFTATPTSPWSPSIAASPCPSPLEFIADAAPFSLGSPGSPASSASLSQHSPTQPDVSPSRLSAPRYGAPLLSPVQRCSRHTFLSGRELRKTQLSPLMVPERGYDASSPRRISPRLPCSEPFGSELLNVDSPKRQRTPNGWTPSSAGSRGTEVPAAAPGSSRESPAAFSFLERPELLRRRSSPLSGTSTPSSCRSYVTASSATSHGSESPSKSPLVYVGTPCESPRSLPLQLFSDLLSSPLGVSPRNKAVTFDMAVKELHLQKAASPLATFCA